MGIIIASKFNIFVKIATLSVFCESVALFELEGG